jgi:hypothetical protein
MSPDWLRYWVNMAEPGYIAVHCFRDSVWDQFPLSEGKVDKKWLDDWAADHERRYHAASHRVTQGLILPPCQPHRRPARIRNLNPGAGHQEGPSDR